MERQRGVLTLSIAGSGTSMHSTRVLISALILSAAIGASAIAAETTPASPLSPAEAQKAFQLPLELRIELAAAEPEVIDPVAIRFDEDGRMWVAEMRDYPQGRPAGGDQHSRIRVLEDRDGDGRFETSTVFADKLTFVTGLQPWDGGVFVTLSGSVTYMKDTDRDGRADVSEVWFTGFAEQNTQLRANHPRLALDNHIYVANGLRGGTVVNKRHPDDKPIDISGRDFRFDPLTGEAEAVSGNGQFGLCFDDWGNRFICSNRNPCKHVVLEDRYLKLNPSVAIPAVVQDVAAFAENSRIFPLSRAWTTSNLHAGQFTAACGVYIYRGDLLPAEYRGNVFTCDPTGNLVHREIMQPNGASFTSKPAYEGKEFLASPDEWFRPVNMELGPDGALYIVDMYRCVIEHPDFVPDELKRRPDQRLGDDRGRIWRIVPAAHRERRATPKLSEAEPKDLVPLLEHPNAWQRETAQRLLSELFEVQRMPLLKRLRQIIGKSDSPLARSHALWLLRRWNSLTTEDVFATIGNPVFRDVFFLYEVGLLKGETNIEEQVVGAVRRDTGPLQFQALLTSLSFKLDLNASSPVNDSWLAESAWDDVWLRRAFQLAIRGDCIELLQCAYSIAWRHNIRQAAGHTELIRELAYRVGSRESDEHAASALKLALSAKSRPDSVSPQPLALLDGLARGLSSRKSSLSKIAASGLNEGEMKALTDWAAAALVMAKDVARDAAARISVINLLATLPHAKDALTDLATSEPDQTIRQNTLAALAEFSPDFDWQPLLAKFASESPAIRRAILDAVLRNPARTSLLLNELESGRIKPAELDLAQANRLSQHRDAAIKARAGKIFGSATPQDRVKALADYQPVLGMKADAQKGRAIFEKNYATCHKVGGIGVNVAPDISDSRTKTAAQLLGDILQPNRAIDSNYVAYSLLTTDGNALTGILALETATSITLRQPGDKSITIARTDIEQLKSSGISLMPEGLEKNIPPADMADLLAFIKNWRYLDGKTPLAESLR